MKKIVLMCQQHGCPMELSPARYQLIHELKKRNYEIFVFFPGSIYDKEIKEEIDHLINTKCLSTKEIKEKIVRINPRHVIAFTYEDARILYRLTRKMKETSFVYYNLEIYTPQMETYLQPEGNGFRLRCYANYICNKIKEVFFVKRCSIFVIQDNLRRRTSAKYFIWHPNTMLIPNSYVVRGSGDDKRIREGIIYSGGINKLQLQSLFDNKEKIPNIQITFSGWSDAWFRTQYKSIEKKFPNIIFLNQKLPPLELGEFLEQYAVGLIWYSPIKDENINNIGLASGKFFKHLSIGQPVIVVDCPGIGAVVEKYKLGIVISSLEELEDAYKKIIKSYSSYCRRVKTIYGTLFNYEKLIQPFLEQLEM